MAKATEDRVQEILHEVGENYPSKEFWILLYPSDDPNVAAGHGTTIEDARQMAADKGFNLQRCAHQYVPPAEIIVLPRI